MFFTAVQGENSSCDDGAQARAGSLSMISKDHKQLALEMALSTIERASDYLPCALVETLPVSGEAKCTRDFRVSGWQFVRPFL